jgi:hypothetical protein
VGGVMKDWLLILLSVMLYRCVHMRPCVRYFRATAKQTCGPLLSRFALTLITHR